MNLGWPTLNWLPAYRYQASTQQYASALSRRQFLLIIGLFWTYVTLSNVLYAYGMRTGIGKITTVSLFAPWNARVLQHVLLLPLVWVSYWASLRIQWRPVLLAIPLQVVLALAFAGLAYPAMIIGEFAVGDAVWHHQMQMHQNNVLDDPMVMSLWLASFVSFLPSYGFGLALVTGLALALSRRSPSRSPAAAAGPPGTTWATRSPVPCSRWFASAGGSGAGLPASPR